MVEPLLLCSALNSSGGIIAKPATAAAAFATRIPYTSNAENN